MIPRRHPADGVATFSVEPMTTAGTLTPLGSLNPPGHVLPTNHVYFYAVDFDHPPAIPDSTIRPVYAPATGTVDYILQSGGNTDWKIAFRATTNFYYYLDHVVLTHAIKVGDIVHAGDQVGISGPGATVDLGAYDMSLTLTGFANPARYGRETLHCVSPWAYFTEPLRSQHYARMRRIASAPDKDGHIDLDVPGHLAGDWYDQSLPIDSTEGPGGWPRTVAFVTDYYDPSLDPHFDRRHHCRAWTLDHSAHRAAAGRRHRRIRARGVSVDVHRIDQHPVGADAGANDRCDAPEN